VVDTRVLRDTFDDGQFRSAARGGERVDVALAAAALKEAEKGVRRSDKTGLDPPKIGSETKRRADPSSLCREPDTAPQGVIGHVVRVTASREFGVTDSVPAAHRYAVSPYFL